MHNQRDVHCICRMNGLAKVDAMRTAIFEIALWWYCYSLWWFHAEPLAAATELVEVSAGAHWVVKLEAEVSMTDGRPPPRLLLQTVVVMTAVTWWRRTAGCSASLQCFILSTCRRLTFDLNHRLLACYWRRPPDRLTTRHPAAKLRSRRREHSEQPTSRMILWCQWLRLLKLDEACCTVLLLVQVVTADLQFFRSISAFSRRHSSERQQKYFLLVSVLCAAFTLSVLTLFVERRACKQTWCDPTVNDQKFKSFLLGARLYVEYRTVTQEKLADWTEMKHGSLRFSWWHFRSGHRNWTTE